jgi:hypothetical protein
MYGFCRTIQEGGKMKWIVFWIVVNTYQIPCTQAGPTIDDFGVVHENNSYTLQLCWDSSEKEMNKEFDTLEQAQVFFNKVTKDCKSCNNIKIKELKPIDGGTK